MLRRAGSVVGVMAFALGLGAAASADDPTAPLGEALNRQMNTSRHFGASLAASGEWMIVSDTGITFGRDSSEYGAGIYAFKWDGATWNLRQEIPVRWNGNSWSNEPFVYGVSMDVHDDLMAASPYRGATRVGGIDVFRLRDGVWEPEAVLMTPDDEYVFAPVQIAVDEDVVAAAGLRVRIATGFFDTGWPQAEEPKQGAPREFLWSVEIYRRVGGVWSHVKRIDVSPFSPFNTPSIDVENGRVFILSNTRSDAANERHGSWTLVGTLACWQEVGGEFVERSRLSGIPLALDRTKGVGIKVVGNRFALARPHRDPGSPTVHGTFMQARVTFGRITDGAMFIEQDIDTLTGDRNSYSRFPLAFDGERAVIGWPFPESDSPDRRGLSRLIQRDEDGIWNVSGVIDADSMHVEQGDSGPFPDSERGTSLVFAQGQLVASVADYKLNNLSKGGAFVFARVVPACTGDANRSGAVNAADMLDVLTSFGATLWHPIGVAGYLKGDADGNGRVDFADIMAVLSNYNTICE